MNSRGQGLSPSQGHSNLLGQLSREGVGTSEFPDDPRQKNPWLSPMESSCSHPYGSSGAAHPGFPSLFQVAIIAGNFELAEIIKTHKESDVGELDFSRFSRFFFLFPFLLIPGMDWGGLMDFPGVLHPRIFPVLHPWKLQPLWILEVSE